MSALVLDVGLLYAEREQLQSGADAAAIAVAKLCAGSDEVCERRAGTIARNIAGHNAKDGQTAATVCGRATTGVTTSINRLSACATDASNLTGCIGPPPVAPEPYAEVRTSTLTGGEPLLPPAFAGAVTGTRGTTVGACSRVSWGPVDQTTSEAALFVSVCDFNTATRSGREFEPPPVNNRDDEDAEPEAGVVLRWRPPNNRGCTLGSRTIPSGFGFPTGSCDRTLIVDRWYGVRRRGGTPDECGQQIHDLHHRLDPVVVAIFDDVRLPDQDNSQFRLHVAGLAVFVITGWRLPRDEEDWERPDVIDHDHPPAGIPNPPLCEPGTNTMCLYGYFTTKVIRVTPDTDLGDLGARHFGALYLRTIG